MRKIHRFTLSAEERLALEMLTRKGKVAATKVVKARALLLADESAEGNGWKDSQIIEAVGIKPATLERLRRRCCEEGPLEALERMPLSSPRKRLVDGDVEARLVATACSEAPAGHASWTLRLLADRLVELEVVGSISTETVRKALKKQA